MEIPVGPVIADSISVSLYELGSAAIVGLVLLEPSAPSVSSTFSVTSSMGFPDL